MSDVRFYRQDSVMGTVPDSDGEWCQRRDVEALQREVAVLKQKITELEEEVKDLGYALKESS